MESASNPGTVSKSKGPAKPAHKSTPLYTTFYSPSWTAFGGTNSQIYNPEESFATVRGPARGPATAQTPATSSNENMSRASSATTAYSDYSTPPPGYQPLARRPK